MELVQYSQPPRDVSEAHVDDLMDGLSGSEFTELYYKANETMNISRRIQAWFQKTFS